MAELDLLSAEGFVEDELGILRLRTAAIEPPAHPLGVGYAEPHWAIWARDYRWEVGWICLFNTATPDADLEKLSADDIERAARLSIALGASWSAVAESAKDVRDVQERALRLVPPQVYAAPFEQLIKLRRLVDAGNPYVVAQLMQLTYHWQTDPGGTYGPRFAG